jgi:hypothetical protein
MRSLLLVLVVFFSASALAQKHMVEFNADSFLLGRLSFTSQKYRYTDAQEDKSGFLFLNYAYTILPQVQVGSQVSYNKYSYGQATSEGYDILVGGIYNFSSDLNKSFYTSLYAGWSWNHQFGTGQDIVHEESFISKVAFGKRFPLTFLNLENFTYSPEVSFQSMNPTKRADKEWEQDFSIKYLQFSVLF